MSHGLVALSSAVVLAVYSAGYLRTQAAADRFTADADQRRPIAPTPATVAPTDLGIPNPATPPEAPPLVEAEPDTTPAAPRADEPAPSVSAIVTPTTVAPVAPVETASKAPAAAPSEIPGITTRAAQNRVTSADTPPVTPAPATAPIPAVTVVAETPATPVVAATPLATTAPAAPRYKDGSFTGWGTSRHGDIEATVVILDGRITSATISQCWTRWPCSWVAALPGQVGTQHLVPFGNTANTMPSPSGVS